jgi:glycosyltransferase involved in cell wall biosynthesis
MPASPKKLIYFTASFPYGLGETWKSNELKYFVEYFDEITVVPYSYGGNRTSPKTLPAGVKLEGPLFETDALTVNTRSVFKLLDRNLAYYLKELLRKKAFLSKTRTIDWLKASLQIKRLLAHPVIRKMLNASDEDTILYFFWGRGSCDILPFTRKRRFWKTVVRFHRFDLFENENGGYIPYRRQLLENVTIAAPSSEIGCEHMRSLYPHLGSRLKVIRLGVIGEGKISASADNILRIVSCSYVVPVKRVHLIARALASVSAPVEWTHVGDGPLMSELKAIVEILPGNIRVDFPGMINSSKVMDFYKARPIDLFLNVSSSEGVPFSIMEVLSGGVPVYATAAGGTGEIIDDSVGKLLPLDITPEELGALLQKFYEEMPERKAEMRTAAFGRYREKCDAEVLAREFAKMVIQ